MKKILLKNLNLKEVEQLLREQLESVFGGRSGSVGDCYECEATCKNGEVRICTAPASERFRLYIL